jgi:hypothetical protein
VTSSPESSNEAIAELARRASDALDVAVAAGAPFDMLERLGAAAGLLRALRDVPNHALMPKVVSRTEHVLRVWERWQRLQARHVVA